MIRSIPSLISLLVALAPAGCKGERGGDAAPAAVEGRALYERYCASCHGLDGQAQTVAAESLEPRPAAFARGGFRHKSTPGSEPPTDRDLAEVIRRGVPGTAMARWPNFDEAEIDALVAHIRSFQEAAHAPSVLPPDALADTKAAAPGSSPDDARPR